jgi:hypothetical protein
VVNDSFLLSAIELKPHIKRLHWKLVIYQNRLDQGQFKIPKLGENKNQLNWPELVMLVESIEILSVKQKPRFEFQEGLRKFAFYTKK